MSRLVNWLIQTNNITRCHAMCWAGVFFRRAGSFTYITRQGMTSLDLYLQLIPHGQGKQLRCRQPALDGLASPRDHRKEAGGH